MTLPQTLFAIIDGTTYSTYFSPFTDSVSVRCSARVAPNTYQDMCSAICGNKTYHALDPVTNSAPKTQYDGVNYVQPPLTFTAVNSTMMALSV